MVVLVIVQSFVLVLLALLVAGLLRSHAEILRRLPPPGGDPGQEPSSPAGEWTGMLPPPGPEPRTAAAASDIVGASLDGASVKISVTAGGRPTLLAFLSSGCATCAGFWEALRPARREPLPGGTRLVVITRDRSMESPTRLRALAHNDVAVVMSSPAWEAYEVPMTPYFVYVGGSGLIEGEGVAEAWPQVLSLLRDALGDAETAAVNGRAASAGNGTRSSVASDRQRGGARGADRERRVDLELRAAGIGQGHPSLYDSGGPAAGSNGQGG
jgi:hypothetical protein